MGKLMSRYLQRRADHAKPLISALEQHMMFDGKTKAGQSAAKQTLQS